MLTLAVMRPDESWDGGEESTLYQRIVEWIRAA
jgi:hypothetical protein